MNKVDKILKSMADQEKLERETIYKDKTKEEISEMIKSKHQKIKKDEFDKFPLIGKQAYTMIGQKFRPDITEFKINDLAYYIECEDIEVIDNIPSKISSRLHLCVIVE